MKSTNRYIQLIALWAIVLIGLTECDTTLDMDEEITGYYPINHELVYAPGINFGDYRTERVVDGKVLEGYLSRDITEFDFKVYYPKDAKEPELTIPYNIAKQGSNIKLIRLPGKKFELYNDKDFTSFNIDLLIYNGYNAMINQQKLVSGKNYIHTKDTDAKITFYKEGEKKPAFTSEAMKLSTETQLTALQISETEFLFLSGSSDNEATPPANNSFSKVRFLWTPKGDFADHQKAQFELLVMTGINWDIGDVEFTAMDKIILNGGELSDWVELEMKFFEELGMQTLFFFNLYDMEGNILLNQQEFLFGNTDAKFDYKFQTWLIDPLLTQPRIIEGISEKW